MTMTLAVDCVNWAKDGYYPAIEDYYKKFACYNEVMHSITLNFPFQCFDTEDHILLDLYSLAIHKSDMDVENLKEKIRKIHSLKAYECIIFIKDYVENDFFETQLLEYIISIKNKSTKVFQLGGIIRPSIIDKFLKEAAEIPRRHYF